MYSVVILVMSFDPRRSNIRVMASATDAPTTVANAVNAVREPPPNRKNTHKQTTPKDIAPAPTNRGIRKFAVMLKPRSVHALSQEIMLSETL